MGCATDRDILAASCGKDFYKRLCQAFSVALSKTSGASGAKKYQSTVIFTDGIVSTGQLLGSNTDRVGIIIFSPLEDFLGIDTQPISDFLATKAAVIGPDTLLIMKQDDWGPVLQSQWFWAQDAPAIVNFTVTEILL